MGHWFIWPTFDHPILPQGGAVWLINCYLSPTMGHDIDSYQLASEQWKLGTLNSIFVIQKFPNLGTLWYGQIVVCFLEVHSYRRQPTFIASYVNQALYKMCKWKIENPSVIVVTQIAVLYWWLGRLWNHNFLKGLFIKGFNINILWRGVHSTYPGCV